MLRKKSLILRIGKYHVLLLQLNIYYKKCGESGWFNDHCLQELLMLLKEPIERRFLVNQLKANKKTKKDVQVEIGTGTTMKFGFQFVEKEVYQSFVIPEEKDEKFRSLNLFEEKLKVTVCRTSSSAVDDLSTSVLLSSSQLPKKQPGISDYFSRTNIGNMTTDSAQKKKSKLQRIFKQGTKTVESDFKSSAGFIPDEENSGELEKQEFYEEMYGGFVRNEHVELEQTEDVVENKCSRVSNYSGKKDMKNLINGKDGIIGRSYTTETENRLENVCHGDANNVCHGGSNNVLRNTEVGNCYNRSKDKEENDRIRMSIDPNLMPDEGKIEPHGTIPNINNVKENIHDKACNSRNELEEEVQLPKNLNDVFQSLQDNSKELIPKKCTGYKKVMKKERNQTTNSHESVQNSKSERLISKAVPDQSHSQRNIGRSNMLQLSTNTEGRNILLENKTIQSSQTTIDSDKEQYQCTDLKSAILPSKAPKRRNKLSLKRQNKDPFNANERLPKKSKRSTSVDGRNKEHINTEMIKGLNSTDKNSVNEKDDQKLEHSVKIYDSLGSNVEHQKENHEHLTDVNVVKEACDVNNISHCVGQLECFTNMEVSEENMGTVVWQESHKNLEINKAERVHKIGNPLEVEICKEDSTTETEVFKTSKIQSDFEISDGDMFLQEDDELLSDKESAKPGQCNMKLDYVNSPLGTGRSEMLSSINDDSLIIAKPVKRKILRLPTTDVSSTDGEDPDQWPTKKRPVTKKLQIFQISDSGTDIDSDRQVLSSTDKHIELSEYCTSFNDDDDDLPEVSVNKKFDAGEVLTRDVDEEMILCDDVMDQTKTLSPFSRKQDEVEAMVVSPELISEDEDDTVISGNCINSPINTIPVESSSKTTVDLTTGTSDDELPNISFTSHVKPFNQCLTEHGTKTDTSGDSLTDSSHQSKIDTQMTDITNDCNLTTPDQSPVFKKRKRQTRLGSKKFQKSTCLNFDSQSVGTTSNEEPEPVCVKKSKYTFKISGTLKNQKDKSVPTMFPINSESATNVNDIENTDYNKPRKRFSQLWKENVTLGGKIKRKNTLFKFGVTRGNKQVNTPKKVETISLLDDDYESGLEESILQARDVDGLTLEEIAFMVWKNEKYLRDIFQGKSNFSERHENYKQGGAKKADLDFKVPLHMYSDEQVESAVEILVKIFCSKNTKYWNYVMKVLLAEALIKIYMDVHHVSYKKAQEIMEEKKKDEKYMQ